MKKYSNSGGSPRGISEVNSTGKDAVENAVLVSRRYIATSREMTMTDIINLSGEDVAQDLGRVQDN